MPAINFQQRFAKMVEKGIKRQTIRGYRKRPFVVGDKLMLYTGMRTKLSHFLRESTAIGVQDIKIEENRVYVDGCELDEENLLKLANDDGFESIDEFFDFFCSVHGLPFQGQLIRW
ncbi:ASCH domain-containing protein [Laspinema olomoucense]|uniref:ASCH domain-containing protein n=1 Tax=Laspinema olomoucense TaxID=3231600 RepID=UPI0021BA6984|nr:ASCH domain-containing protein [Laspinema sp. D3d]MCT7971183.1 ASCH domain-containing protein [Laspinema sp. D3d]